MPRKALTWSMLMGFASFIIIHAYAENSGGGHRFSGGGRFRDDMRKMQEFKASLIRHDSISAAPPPSVSPSPSPSYVDPPPVINGFVYFVLEIIYG